MISISGKVIRGAGYGKQLGFPTANMDRADYTARKLDVSLGVYAGTALIQETGERFPAGIVIGPIDEIGLPKLEAHLLDFGGDLYGQTLTLALGQFLRPFRVFPTENALKEQIARDLLRVRELIPVKS